jgi:hypothetical protein
MRTVAAKMSGFSKDHRTWAKKHAPPPVAMLVRKDGSMRALYEINPFKPEVLPQQEK